MPNETIKCHIHMLPFICGMCDRSADFLCGDVYLDIKPVLLWLRERVRGWISYPVKCDKCGHPTMQQMDVEILGNNGSDPN